MRRPAAWPGADTTIFPPCGADLMTSIGQISVTDLNVWQARALRVLAELQQAGLKAERYPLEWSLTTNGTLCGRVSRYERQTDNDRRAVFDEWVHVLAGTEPFDGGTRLTSVFTVPTGRGADVRGTLTIDFAGHDEL